jgi:peptidoglycan/LPS O-acetylase OafA/YrhL
VNQRLSLIEFLRGLAAAWVVLMHASGWLVAQGNPPLAQKLWSFGYVGVDIFFVISGFVIAGSFARSNASPFSFFKARLIRIVPAYWIVTLVTLGAIVLMRLLDIQSTWADAVTLEQSFYSLFFLSGLVLGVEPVVYQGWTLEVEMAFYLVFAISIFFSKRRISPELVPLIIIPILALLGVWMPMIAIEFCFGILASIVYRTNKLEQGLSRMIGWGLMIAAGIFLVVTLPTTEAMAARAVALGVPAAILILGAAFASRGAGKTLSLIGASSYAVYLWQVLTVPLTLGLTQIFLFEMPSTAHLLFALTSTLCLGVITDRYLDLPLRRFLTQKLVRPGDSRKLSGG